MYVLLYLPTEFNHFSYLLPLLLKGSKIKDTSVCLLLQCNRIESSQGVAKTVYDRSIEEL